MGLQKGKHGIGRSKKDKCLTHYPLASSLSIDTLPTRAEGGSLIKDKTKQDNKGSSRNQQGDGAEKKVARSAGKIARPRKQDFGVAIVYGDITERKTAEAEIAHLTSFPENNPNPVIEINLDGKISYMNPIARLLFPDMASVGMNHPFLAGVEDLLKAFHDGKTHTIKRQLKIVNMWWAETVSIDPSTGNLRFYGTDITGYKLGEEKLREREAQYRMLAEHTADTVWLMDRDLNITYVSPTVQKLRGFTPQEILDLPLEKQLTPDSLKLAYELFFKELPKADADPSYSPIYTLELEFSRKDGTTVWAESKFTIIRDPSGKPISILAEARDITERRLLEEILRESEEKFRNVFDNSAIGKLITSLDRTVIVNQAFADMLGYTKEELSHIKWQDISHPDDIDEIKRKLEPLQAGREKYARFVKRYVKKNGAIVWGDVSTVLQMDNGGKPLYYITSIIDITERKKAEEALQKSETLLKSTSEMAKVGGWEVDAKTFEVNWSEETYRIHELPLGHKPPLEEAINYFHPDERQKLSDSIQRSLKYGEAWDLEMRFTSAKGKHLWTRAICFPVIENGKTVRLKGTFQDITERKLAQQIIEKQREEYRTIFDAVRPMIMYKDKEGVIQRINKSGAATVNRDPKEMVGKTLYDFFPAAEADKFAEEDKQVIASGKPLIGLISEYTRPSGRKRWAQIDRIPYFDANGDVMGIITLSQDITRRKLAEQNLEKSYASLKKTLNDAIQTMVKIVEMRDPYTAGHQQKVADLATAIAGKMNLEDTRIEQLKMAAVVHDIGKMQVSSDILSKPGKLSHNELELIQAHAQHGYDIVKSMDFPCSIAQAILQHHERLDGSGYPNGLKGEDILLEAKILAVADTIEAMASHRPYRPALGIDKALDEISKNRGTLYDPDVVDACLEVFNSDKFQFKPG
jgi:PAS domain S-box-containing protein/putative nucleotidyltransferase with HDIG domain